MVIIVFKDNIQFLELLKTVTRNVNPGVTGNSITKMRQTKTGDLVIEIIGDANLAEVVRAEVARSLGSGTAEDFSLIEIRDLDGETTGEEVINALSEKAVIMEPG